jgi:hypothetical protein
MSRSVHAKMDVIKELVMQKRIEKRLLGHSSREVAVKGRKAIAGEVRPASLRGFAEATKFPVRKREQGTLRYARVPSVGPGIARVMA